MYPTEGDSEQRRRRLLIKEMHSPWKEYKEIIKRSFTPSVIFYGQRIVRPQPAARTSIDFRVRQLVDWVAFRSIVHFNFSWCKLKISEKDEWGECPLTKRCEGAARTPDAL